MSSTTNIVEEIMDYEMGMMNETEMLLFFSRLIKTGIGYQLQGSYGRTCDLLISSGLISTDGELI